MDRRQFLIATAALAAPPSVVTPRGASTMPASVRANFPVAAARTYLDSAAIHPMGRHTARALERHIAFRLNGPGEGRGDFGASEQVDLKRRFAALINAKPTEIAFVQNTSDGENIVVSGLDLTKRGGNIVIDELHFVSSLYMYKALEARGLELRVVKHRDWAIDLDDVERVVDRNTRLVSLALVSNVNGYLHDARAIADVAHAHGAYLYADIVQAVGAIPVDVRALGLDFAATATYKWLMGERGFGYLFVREDLQDTVVPTTRYGHRQLARFDRLALSWETLPGAARYETGTFPNALALCSSESLAYIDALGLPTIRAHANELTSRLQKELPAAGYASLTPAGNGTPIVAFQLRDAGATAARLKRANIAAAIVPEERRLRLSVSVFNTHEDVDRIVRVLAD
jgi:selenocysteine lyase/cysteine desulfurase